jgi:hypothetical protein
MWIPVLFFKMVYFWFFSPGSSVPASPLYDYSNVPAAFTSTSSSGGRDLLHDKNVSILLTSRRLLAHIVAFGFRTQRSHRDCKLAAGHTCYLIRMTHQTVIMMDERCSNLGISLCPWDNRRMGIPVSGGQPLFKIFLVSLVLVPVPGGWLIIQYRQWPHNIENWNQAWGLIRAVHSKRRCSCVRI